MVKMAVFFVTHTKKAFKSKAVSFLIKILRLHKNNTSELIQKAICQNIINKQIILIYVVNAQS